MQPARPRHRVASGRAIALATTFALAGGLLSSLVSVTKAQAATMPTTWTQDTATSPPARSAFSMAYDGVNARVILFGGSTQSCSLFCTTTYLNDTWEYDGKAWTQLSPASSPSARSNAMMTWDAATNSVLLFGGTTASGDGSDTWRWNGSTWTQLSPASSPSARDTGYLAYSAALSQIVLFGGSSNTDTWTWNGTTWTQQAHGGSDPTSSGGAMAYDAATQNVVYQMASNSYPTYNWTPVCCNQPPTQAAWSDQGYVGQPNPTGSTMAYDPNSQTNIMFGGGSSGLFGSTINNATWSYNGYQWTQESPTTSPSARYGAQAVDDQALGEVVLFGGTDANGNVLNDTWQWGDPIGVYGAYGAQSYATTAINDGWPIIADAGGTGTSTSPYTVEYQSTPDKNVEQAIAASGKPRSAITWMSFWTVGAPASGDTWNNDGYQAGRKAASTLVGYSSTVLPDYVILDDEGPGGPPSTSANWTSWLQGWASGIASINSGLRTGFYANESQFQTYGLTSQAIPGFVAESPILNHTPAVKGGNVTGYIAYYGGCPAASYENQIKSWGGRFNTLQFQDSGVDCGP